MVDLDHEHPPGAPEGPRRPDHPARQDGGNLIQQRAHARVVFFIFPDSVLGRLGTKAMCFGTMMLSSRR